MGSIITERLKQVERRLRWGRSLSLASVGLSIGLVLSLALTLAGRFTPILNVDRQIAADAALISVAALLFAAVAFLRGYKSMEVAKFVDRRAGLKERISTAVELEEKGDNSPLAMAQREDAERAAAGLNPKALTPLSISPKRLLPAFGLLVALIFASLLPNPMHAVLEEKAATAQAVKEEQAKIEKISKELRETTQSSPTEKQEEVLRAIDQLAEDLSRPAPTKEEALAKIAGAEEKLTKLVDRNLPGERLGLEQLAKGLQGLSKIDPSIQAGASSNPEQLGEDLSKLAERLDEMTREDQGKAADSLSTSAGALSGSNSRLATQLGRATDALREGNLQEARDSLNRAAEELGEMDRRLADQTAAERALSQLQASRGTIARAGSPQSDSFVRSTTGSSGSGNSGQNSGANQGSGNSGTQGTGTGAPQGSGNVAGTTAPTSPGAISSSSGQPATGRPGTTGTGSYEPVFTPGGLDGEGQPMFLPGVPDGGENESEWVSTQPGSGSSVVPYSQIFGSYSAAAARSLEGSDVPVSLKEYVRGYFTSLEPAPKE